MENYILTDKECMTFGGGCMVVRPGNCADKINTVIQYIWANASYMKINLLTNEEGALFMGWTYCYTPKNIIINKINTVL